MSHVGARIVFDVHAQRCPPRGRRVAPLAPRAGPRFRGALWKHGAKEERKGGVSAERARQRNTSGQRCVCTSKTIRAPTCDIPLGRASYDNTPPGSAPNFLKPTPVGSAANFLKA